jgi:phosphoribosylformimino-5-aminoimidazole carboxamide ribotide isomerase
MRIIPAIDIIDGKCVRLSQGDYDTKNIQRKSIGSSKRIRGLRYRIFTLGGFRWIKSKQIINYKTLELIASKTNLKLILEVELRLMKILELL